MIASHSATASRSSPARSAQRARRSGEVEARPRPRPPAQLDRLAQRGAGIAVRVDGTGRLGGRDERAAGEVVLAAGEPVLRHEPRRSAAPNERRRRRGGGCHAASSRARPRTRPLWTSAWRNAAVPDCRLGDEPERRRLLEVGGSAELLDHVELEALPGDRRRLERRARAVAELSDAKQHGVAHRVGTGISSAGAQREPVSAGVEHPSGTQRRDKLLDEEGDALRAVVEHSRERRSDTGSE